MLFNSIDFAIFLPIVFILYWFIGLVAEKNIKLQNLFILLASYVFYGWWNWKFLSLILFTTLVDYSVGLGFGKIENKTKRKLLLVASLIANLGLLGFFKYYNFFLENFITAFSLFGTHIQANTLNIILPIGISFYTFQSLSYSIDVYKKRLLPEKNLTTFAAFVTFFPQLMAGPIERATHLLPQFSNKREFNYTKAVNGLRQILWGLFKKIVIADNCALYANEIFNNSANYPGSTLVLGALYFTIQIYGDFSGYSDIAIGTARLFDFDLMKNFAFPYFSRDIAEFWRRWHISLSTWFRDYIYIPLGGSKGGTFMKVRNIFIIFLVSGLWHGANWTFIAWGALNAIYFLPLLLIKQNRKNLNVVAEGRFLPSFKEFIGMTITFGITIFAWIFFRAENIGHAIHYIAKIFSMSLFTRPEIEPKIIIVVIFFTFIEWLGRNDQYAIEHLMSKWPKTIRWAFYYCVILAIFLFAGKEQQFIYFQF